MPTPARSDPAGFTPIDVATPRTNREIAMFDGRRHLPVIATVVLAAAFATVAGLQAWHSQRARTIDQAVMAARTEREALLDYLASYEHQICGLLLPGSSEGNRGPACEASLSILESGDTLSASDLGALRHALNGLDAILSTVTQTLDIDATGPHATADARQLGIELNALNKRLMPPIERRIAELETKRTRAEAYWGVGNLLCVTLLALSSILFVWRLTKRLSAERAFAQRVIDVSPVAMLWKDTEGRLLGYNNVFAKILGLSVPGEAIGKTARELGLREEDARVFDAQERYVIKSGQPLLNVQEQIGPPNRQRWLSISRVPLHDSRGRVSGILINFTEESERIAAEQSALEMSGRLAMGLNAAHGGEWEWNLQTDAVDLSDRWLSLFGIQRTRETVHLDYLRERVHPDDISVIEAALNDYFTGRTKEYRAEYRLRIDGNRYRWTLGCGRVVERDAAGKPVRMQGINLDIEPAKQAEDDLRAVAERADAANRAKSDFLATMSHELRTPLSGVIGMTELLRDTTLDDRQRSLVGSCRFSSRLLLDLINGLLDFSKIEAGRMELDRQPFSPERCVWSAAAVMALHAHQAGLELDIEIEPAIPAQCLGDNGRLRQVLVNLMANAVKFTEAGRVRVQLTAVQGPQDPDTPVCWLSFAVTDTGIGIPAEKQAQLFEPFVQTDPSITRRYGGSGLGLSISRSLVEAMGGHIDVDSAEGRGSTFTVTVPFETVQAATQPDPPPDSAPRLRGRVRLTDPDPISRPHLTRRLQGLGLEVLDTGKDEHAACDVRVTNVWTNAARNMTSAAADSDPTPHLRLTPVTCPAPPPGAGPTRSLAKPCCDRQLNEALRALLHGDAGSSPRRASYPTPTTPLPDPADAKSPDAEVLVVEDDLTNRQYLAELLRRQGVACNVSTNGRDAVERYTRRLAGDHSAYRLVLMDYHLPVLDGWAATRAIRDAEAAAGAKAAVILGVTAAGEEGDRTTGTAAGIDGWLSKPIDPKALQAAIEQHVTQMPLDAETALERCMGNTAFLSATLDSFSRTLPKQIDALEAALDQGDTAAAAATAHTIKGAAGLVTAFSLRDLAARFEHLGREPDARHLDEMRQQFDALRQETDRCINYAVQIRNGFAS